jgi:hypothetical protein
VPSIIHFTGSPDHKVTVDEDVEAVNDALMASMGSVPVALTVHGNRIYVTPANIAYWEAKSESTP